MDTLQNPTQLLDTKAAAEFLGVKPSSLTVWRSTRKVRIPFIRIGACVRYRRSELESFLESNRQEG